MIGLKLLIFSSILLSLDVPNNMALPIWLTAIGVVTGSIVTIVKAFTPIFEAKQNTKNLEDKLKILEEDLLNCEKDTLQNRNQNVELVQNLNDLRKDYDILISKISLLKDLQEEQGFKDLLSKLE